MKKKKNNVLTFAIFSATFIAFWSELVVECHSRFYFDVKTSSNTLTYLIPIVDRKWHLLIQPLLKYIPTSTGLPYNFIKEKANSTISAIDVLE